MGIRVLFRFFLALASVGLVLRPAVAQPVKRPRVILLARSVASQRAVLRVGSGPMQVVDAGQLVAGLDATLREVRPSGVVLVPRKPGKSGDAEIRIAPIGGTGVSAVTRIRTTAPRTAIWAAGNASPAVPKTTQFTGIATVDGVAKSSVAKQKP